MIEDTNFFGFSKKFWISSAILFILLWWFFHKVGTLITVPFGFALIVAYIFSSIAEKIHKKIKIPKSIISATIVVALFSVLILFCISFTPIAIKNIHLILENIPIFSETIQNILIQYLPVPVNKIVMDSYSHISDNMPSITSKLFAYFGNLSSFFSQMFTFFVITPIASYYMIKDWNTINEHIVSLIPNRNREAFILIRAQIRERLAGYIVGQVYIILFLSSFYGFALFVVGLEFGLTIGILTGIASIIPYVGLATGFITAIMVALLNGGDTTYILMISSIFIVGQIVEGSFLTPKLMSSKIDIHPLWIVFGFLVCGVFFGFFGVLFALPITAIASVLIKFYVENYYKKNFI